MTFFYLFIHVIYLINYIYIIIYKLRKLAYIIILQEIKYLTVIKRG